MYTIFVALLFVGNCLCDVSHLSHLLQEPTTPSPPHRPYSFHTATGRFPGKIDRIHQESSDGSGIVRGSYSFIDPKHEVRTVEYVADKNGFHPHLTNYEDTQAFPVDSEAVRLAKAKHFALYQKIASANAAGPARSVPRDTASVAHAKNRHFHLYEKIAAEHAAIASQREAERLAFEATSVPNDVEDKQIYF